MRKSKEALLIFFEAAAIGGTLLLLPCAVAHVALGCGLTDIVAQATLAAVSASAILTGVAIHEGWYLDHLGRIGERDQADGEDDDKAEDSRNESRR